MIGYRTEKCRICGKVDACNEGICARHSADVAQAYLFGFEEGTRATPSATEGAAVAEAFENGRRVMLAYVEEYGIFSGRLLLGAPSTPACEHGTQSFHPDLMTLPGHAPKADAGKAETCRRCNGKGAWWADEAHEIWTVCFGCNGTGKRPAPVAEPVCEECGEPKDDTFHLIHVFGSHPYRPAKKGAK